MDAKDHPPSPAPSQDELAAYIEASLPLSGIPVEREWRPGILAHLTAIAAAARLVLDLPLEEEIEQAPIYEA